MNMLHDSRSLQITLGEISLFFTNHLLLSMHTCFCSHRTLPGESGGGSPFFSRGLGSQVMLTSMAAQASRQAQQVLEQSAASCMTETECGALRLHLKRVRLLITSSFQLLLRLSFPCTHCVLLISHFELPVIHNPICWLTGLKRFR